MTTATTALGDHELASGRPVRRLAFIAFGALLLRDLRVVRKQWRTFLARVVSQPLLVVFVFGYVFPKIGQGIGGGGAAQARFTTLLAPGMIAIAVIFQGIQAVALPLVNEFGYTREIEDRVMAPVPVWGVAAAKIFAGAVQSAIAACVVVPLVLVIPSAPVTLSISWIELLTVGPLACVLAGSLGLAIGTSFEPRQVSLIFSIIVLPMTFLGACYYPWERLGSIEWLRWAVLVNPLVYVSEGLRMAMTDIPHMSAWGVYAGLLGFTALLARIGINGFTKRVLS
jgi:ABC-2 type transport system permease protein